MQNENNSLERFIDEQRKVILTKKPNQGAKTTRSNRISVKRKPIYEEPSKRNMKSQIRGLEDKLSIFAHEKAVAETKAGQLEAQNKLYADEVLRLRGEEGEKGKSDFYKTELENQKNRFDERERANREYFEKREKDLIEKVEKLAEYKNKFYEEKQTSNSLKEELEELKTQPANNNRHYRSDFSLKRKYKANNEYKNSQIVMPNSLRK